MFGWGKRALAAALPLLLASCLWGPGKFTSDLALRKNGTFTLDYRGEIWLQLPEDKGTPPEPWSEKMAHCYADGRTTNFPVVVVVTNKPDGTPGDAPPEPKRRQCTKAELDKLKMDQERSRAERIESKSQESEQMGKMFGLPGRDDESNRRFAATLMKYQGWRSVRYVGKGMFDVDYHVEGRVTQDFVFPVMPDSDLIIPFVTIRRRIDGSVMVSAPAFTGGSGAFGVRAKALGMPDNKDGPASRARGVFAITTDGEILTNNSDDGPAAVPAGRRVHWDVGPGSTKVPEMLVRL